MFLTYDEYLVMGGALDRAAFTANERKARAYINLATHNRIRDETPVRECVRNAVFDLIGLLAQEANSVEGAGSGVSSKSNDSVSVTYADWKTINAYWQSRKRELLVEYLADETVTRVVDGVEIPVPLLYGGVEYDGGDAI